LSIPAKQFLPDGRAEMWAFSENADATSDTGAFGASLGKRALARVCDFALGITVLVVALWLVGAIVPRVPTEPESC
jgi:hypothetical protein